MNFAASNALHLKKRCMMLTDNEKNAFLLYDFLNRKIKVTYYSIKAKTNDSSNFLRSWQILGSNDKITWDILDDVLDDTSTCGIGLSNTFQIKNKPKDDQFYRYIKLLQTDVNSSCYYHLALTNFELFGIIYQEK